MKYYFYSLWHKKGGNWELVYDQLAKPPVPMILSVTRQQATWLNQCCREDYKWIEYPRTFGLETELQAS